MTTVFIFLIVLFCALWITTSNQNRKKFSKQQPGSSSDITAGPIVTDNSFTPFADVNPSSDLPINDAGIHHWHNDHHHHHRHDHGTHNDTGSQNFNSSDFSGHYH